MSCSRPSDPAGGLDLDRDLPVTAADREALRRCRSRPRPALLARPELLAWPSWLPAPRHRRPTHAGLAPFEL